MLEPGATHVRKGRVEAGRPRAVQRLGMIGAKQVRRGE